MKIIDRYIVVIWCDNGSFVYQAVKKSDGEFYFPNSTKKVCDISRKVLYLKMS